jgi:hypothetical protein
LLLTPGINTLVMTRSGGRVRPRGIAVALAIIAPQLAHAQVVRGMVTERVSGAPLAGVVVSIANVRDSLRPGGIRHGLTNSRGEFAVALPGAGSYTLSAKRIGVARFNTPVFVLGAGESRRFDIALAAFEFRLPQVHVLATNLCIPKRDQLRTIVALWDEVRTALIAAEISREEHLLRGWLSQYTRTLEPRTLRILQEQRSVAEGAFDRPMRSISGDSLAKVGYWRRQDADTLVFYGPDAEALLSEPFLSGHCFELVAGRGQQRGFAGLSFRPRRTQYMGGIEGTIWIDGRTFELRYVDFRYTNLITSPRNVHLGGEVHFLRHDSGGWVVRRWFVRMPQFPQVTPMAEARSGRLLAPQAWVYRVIEEGGGLFMPGLKTWERPGVITGTVVDSTGRAPLRGTLVSLSGTPYSVEVDSSGAFRFDSIPPGAYTLLASHRDYADLGQLVDDEPLTLASGQEYRAHLRGVSTPELLAILCGGGKTVKLTDATLRITARDAESGEKLERVQFWLRWPDPAQKEPLDPITPGIEQKLLGIHSMTDESGSITFCGVPSDTRLELVMPRSDDDPDVPQAARFVRVTGFILRPGEITSRTIMVRPPR